MSSDNRPTRPCYARRAVFLDRDGVLNRSDVRGGRPYAPTRLGDFHVIAEAPAAVARLRAAGFLAIVVTNQKDVGRGITLASLMDAMHDRLRAAIAVDDLYACTDPDEGRGYKPDPGMLLDAAEKWTIDLAASYMVGDRWRDVGAGRNAGCTTIFIDCGYTEALSVAPDHTVSDVAAAADLILALETARAERPGHTRD